MLFTSVILVLIISFLLLINHWSQNKGVLYLVSAILLLSSRQLSLLLASTTEYVDILTALLIHTDPLTALTGPLIFYYFKSLVKGKFVIDYYFLFFTIPALLFLFNTSPYYGFPWERKVHFFILVQHSIPYKGLSHFPYLFFPYDIQRSALVFFNLSMIIYSFRYLVLLKRDSSVYLKKKVTALIGRLVIIIPLIILSNWIPIIYSTIQAQSKEGLVFRHPAFTANGYLFFQVLILPLSFFFVPSWLYNDHDSSYLFTKWSEFYKRLTSSSKGFHETPSEKSDDLDRIVSYIEKEKPYLNTTFSLHDISRSLNIPHIRVTTCFSKQLKVPFPAYRNKLRVEHATDLFRSGAHLTTSIEGIAAMSGFKSKSIFYTAFKTVYGVNPMEWMKENL